MATMVLLTFLVGLITVRARFQSVKKGEVRAKYYKLMQGQEIPEFVTKSTRSFNNMFEVPLLFYVACTLYISLALDSTFGLAFAWLFVIVRGVHAFIHLTYNHVLHRLIAFALSCICVVVLWSNLLIQHG